MNRRIVLISSVSLGLLLGVTTLAILTCNSSSKVTVRFVNSESSNGEFPSYAPSERLDFAVRNVGSKPASVEVSEIQDEQALGFRRAMGLAMWTRVKTHSFTSIFPWDHPSRAACGCVCLRKRLRFKRLDMPLDCSSKKPPA